MLRELSPFHLEKQKCPLSIKSSGSNVTGCFHWASVFVAQSSDASSFVTLRFGAGMTSRRRGVTERCLRREAKVNEGVLHRWCGRWKTRNRWAVDDLPKEIRGRWDSWTWRTLSKSCAINSLIWEFHQSAIVQTKPSVSIFRSRTNHNRGWLLLLHTQLKRRCQLGLWGHQREGFNRLPLPHRKCWKSDHRWETLDVIREMSGKHHPYTTTHTPTTQWPSTHTTGSLINKANSTLHFYCAHRYVYLFLCVCVCVFVCVCVCDLPVLRHVEHFALLFLQARR